MPFCEKCGGSIEPGSKFCDNCGVPIDDLAPQQPAPIPPPPRAPRVQGPPVPTAPPTSAPIPPIYIVVGIAVVVIIIALVFASGVMSGSSKQVVTPTVKQVTPAKQVTTISTPTPKRIVAPGQDPIIGVWRYTSSGYGADTDTYQFIADGTFTKRQTFWDESMASGTWSANGGNSYRCVYSGGISFIINYDPAKNAIYEPGSPHKFFIQVT